MYPINMYQAEILFSMIIVVVIIMCHLVNIHCVLGALLNTVRLILWISDDFFPIGAQNTL